MEKNCKDCGRYDSGIRDGCRIWVKNYGNCEYFTVIDSEMLWGSVIGICFIFVALLCTSSAPIAVKSLIFTMALAYGAFAKFYLERHNSCRLCGNVKFLTEKDLANHIKSKHIKYR